MTTIPIVCLGCNERAEIPFIPPDLTCVACKTGEHIDFDDADVRTASAQSDSIKEFQDAARNAPTCSVCGEKANHLIGGPPRHAFGEKDHPFTTSKTSALGEPDLPMMLLPSGVPDQDQDVEPLRETDEKRKVLVPKGSAPYSQRALAAKGDAWEHGLDPAKGEGQVYSCSKDGNCDFTGTADEMEAHYADKHPEKTSALTKSADLGSIRNLLAQFNGKNVTVTYDDDLGLHTVAGPLTYHPPTVVVGQSNTTDVHVLELTVNGYGDFPDQRTEPVAGSAVTWLQNFPSGATAAKTATYVPHKWVDSDGYSACIVCGIPEDEAAPINGPMVGCIGSTPPNEPRPYHDPMDEPISQYANRDRSAIAKIDQIQAAVLHSNPGMNQAVARKVAVKTLARYPKVAAGA